MRTPLTNRQCAYKTFYIFFAFGGKYSGRYAVIQAQSYEKAQLKALEEYGACEIRGVVKNKEQAESRIAAYKLARI